MSRILTIAQSEFLTLVKTKAFIIGIFLMPVLILAHFILTILGALQANKGVAYRYPFALRLLK